MISVYVHIPFCVSKCIYCGFSSTIYSSDVAETYLAALGREMSLVGPTVRNRNIVSLYIGGGTPTALSDPQLIALFDLVRSRISAVLPSEVTIEMNPATASPETLRLLKTLGATRISIGVQSFNDVLLRSLGRIHTADDAKAAVREAHAAGFRSVGIDLMYGIPGQSPAELQRTIETAIQLKPEHLSLYSLSLEEGTGLADAVRAGRIVLPDDDAVASLYESARQRVADEGYVQYELSNFALPGHACRHNLHYWERGEYLGFGPSAWSFVGDRRWMNVSDLPSYEKRTREGLTPVEQEERLGAVQADSERLFLGLRRTDGIDLSAFEALQELLGRESFRTHIESLDRIGMVEFADGRLRLTPRGMLLSNEVMERLLP